MATYENVTYNSPDGAQIGSSATEKVGFHGAVPSAQRSGAAQAAATFTVSATAGRGFTTSAKFNAFVDLVLELRAALVEKGLIKGGS